MADRLRLVSFSSGGRPVVIRDLNDGTKLDFLRGTFKITAPQRNVIGSQSARRYGGSKSVGESHENGSIEFETYAKDTTPAATLDLVDDTIMDLESTATDRYIEWRPEAATRSVYFPLRGNLRWECQYDKREFDATSVLHMKFTFDVAPLAEGDRMDIIDDFSVDTITAGDYTVDASAGTLSVSGGTVIFNNTGRAILRHTARGHQFADGQATVKFTTPTSTASLVNVGVILRGANASNWLLAYVSGTSTSASIGIHKNVAGVESSDLGGSGAGTLVANTTYWIRGRVEGNTVYVEFFTSLPTPTNTPSFSASYVLTAAEQAALPSGYAGLTGSMATITGASLDDFTVEPYTYANFALSQPVKLPGIPGDAPAKMDVTSAIKGNGSASRSWGVIAWAKTPLPINYLWNGSFEFYSSGKTDGWTNASISNMSNAATSITAVNTAAKYGTFSGQVVTPGSAAFEGVSFPIYRTFKRGRTYTASIWYRQSAGTARTPNLRLGDGPNNDHSQTAGPGVGSTTWQQIVTTWVPVADRTVAWLTFESGGTAVAGTWQIDGAMVYEGTVSPAGKHVEGFGAQAPWGVIEAENFIPNTFNSSFTGSGVVLNTDATASGGRTISTPSIASAGTFNVSWMVDPTCLQQDDYLNDVNVEVYARYLPPAGLTGSLPIMTLSSTDDWTGYGTRYTEEFGSSGRPVQYQNGLWNLTRLGTISLPVRNTTGRRVLTLTIKHQTGQTGAWTLDCLILVPTRQRAANPTTKADDLGVSTYPAFLPTFTTDLQRRTFSDLSGTVEDIANFPGVTRPYHSMGGQLLEIAPGDNEALVYADAVPDPTNNAPSSLIPTGTIHYAITPRYFLTRGA